MTNHLPAAVLIKGIVVLLSDLNLIQAANLDLGINTLVSRKREITCLVVDDPLRSVGLPSSYPWWLGDCLDNNVAARNCCQFLIDELAEFA